MRRLILILSLLLSSCIAASDEAVGGRIILWHDNDAATGAALESLSERFMEINPNIRVSLVAVPADDMRVRYASAAELSLGPDLFIGDSTWIRPLAMNDLIQPIGKYDPSLDQYLSAAIENVTYNDEIYGIPYELLPSALYYNADLVTNPPETLTDLMDQAADGMGLAMTTRFDRAFWGVRAFGGQPFDDETGRVTLDRGGFASWLTWMNTAQNTTGMFLNNDRATLMALFTSERAAYYIGTPDDLPALREAMGEDANIRVVPLPAGPGGSAAPLLHLDVLMFNSASAARNTRAALELARFLTNDENSLRLAREIGHVPANLRVAGIDARTYPIVNGFMTQARSALPIQNTDAMFTILREGERLYRQVLDGVVDPTLAATSFTENINEVLGFDEATPSVAGCVQSGEIRLWHVWQDDEQAVLDQIIDRFGDFCPDVTVTSTAFNSETELIISYRALHDANIKPDVIIVSNSQVYELVSNELIQPVQGDTVQQFVPQALNALTYQNNIYGTPITLNLSMLFYNADLVTDLPRTLDDLISEAAEGRAVALSTDFEQAYWGISTFGGGLLDSNMSLTINQNDAMVTWLSWLQEAATLPGMVVGGEAGREAFRTGEAAYYIGSLDYLPDFIDSLGKDTVAIAELPGGPAGEAFPILHTHALMVNATVEENRQALIQAFVDYATNPENQALLFSEAALIPANINFEVDDDSNLVPIRSQVARVTILPNTPEADTVLRLGNNTYRVVLEGETSPAEAVATFVARYNEQNSTPTPEATVEISPTP